MQKHQADNRKSDVARTVFSIWNRYYIFYSDNVQFTGISGFAHNYDFLLQRTKAKPERLCQAVNNPNKSSMGNILFAWNDTKPSRKNGSQLVVILNDQNTVAKGVEDAFANYDVKVIRWSQREKEENIALVSAWFLYENAARCPVGRRCSRHFEFLE